MSQNAHDRKADATTSHFYLTGIVKVVVGTQPLGEKTFSVHKGLICARSRFFRNAMNHEWTEGRESTVRFPSDSAETFEYYLGVLYCNAVPNISGATEGITFRVLVNLYVLAEKLVDIKTKNIVVEAILGRLKEFKWPLADVIRGLYEGTPSGSPARRLLADRFAEVGDVEKHLSLGSTVLPQDFWIDITKALTAYRERLIKRGPMKSVFED